MRNRVSRFDVALVQVVGINIFLTSLNALFLFVPTRKDLTTKRNGKTDAAKLDLNIDALHLIGGETLTPTVPCPRTGEEGKV